MSELLTPAEAARVLGVPEGTLAQWRSRRREMLRFICRNGLRNASSALEPGERRFVSIKRARSFRAALAHVMECPAKFLSVSTPEHLVELEAAFHKTRRFSRGGAFYRLKPMREPGEDSPVVSCPICGAQLCEVFEPWVPIFALESEQRAVLSKCDAKSDARTFPGARFATAVAMLRSARVARLTGFCARISR